MKKITLNPKILYNRYLNKKPWLEIVSEGIDKSGITKLEFDWNKAFIEHIRSFGFVGHNEEECVQLYLEAITKKVSDEMEEDVRGSDAHPTLSNTNNKFVG